MTLIKCLWTFILLCGDIDFDEHYEYSSFVHKCVDNFYELYCKIIDFCCGNKKNV